MLTQTVFACIDVSIGMMQSILVDPVIAADGHTYERAAMVKRLQHCMTSPVTGDMLPHPLLVPNFAVKAMITNQCLRA